MAAPTMATNGRPVPLNLPSILPLALITSLFFLWALGVNLNDVLIPHPKKAFRLGPAVSLTVVL
jgi:fucose permease